MSVPRLLIAGTHSGVGKTTISTGIMAALTARGMQVQGFKVGPDYIDPSYHTGATGRASRNLDIWLLGENLLQTFKGGVEGADIAVIEGVMGLFDGIKGKQEGGSSAHIAALLDVPVILIVDVHSMAYSAAAVVHGFATFEQKINVAGVILNRVGSPGHYAMVKEGIEELGIPVIGHLGQEENLVLPERHLGLVPLGEEGSREDYFGYLAQVIEQTIDLDKLISLAVKHSPNGKDPVEASAGKLSNGKSPEAGNYPSCQSASFSGAATGAQLPNLPNLKIAVAKDEAFSFYYQDALDLLIKLGATITYFSPLHDTVLPQGTDGIIIGGGFPESFLPQLTANLSLHASLQAAYKRGIPIYAECGGLMYLCTEIKDFDQQGYAGVGLVPGTCQMTRRLQGMGYREGETLEPSILGPEGTLLRGHEFHYSKVEYSQSRSAYRLRTATGEARGLEGFVQGNLLVSYLHQNFAGNPQLAANFLQTCRSNQEDRGCGSL